MLGNVNGGDGTTPVFAFSRGGASSFSLLADPRCGDKPIKMIAKLHRMEAMPQKDPGSLNVVCGAEVPSRPGTLSTVL